VAHFNVWSSWWLLPRLIVLLGVWQYHRLPQDFYIFFVFFRFNLVFRIFWQGERGLLIVIELLALPWLLNTVYHAIRPRTTIRCATFFLAQYGWIWSAQHERLWESKGIPPMQITPVVLNLTNAQLLALQDAISYRYRQQEASGTDSREVAALRDLKVLMDRYWLLLHKEFVILITNSFLYSLYLTISWQG